MSYPIRKATGADRPALEELISHSARHLNTHDYSKAQIEGALRGTFGVDSQLIADGTYFVAEAEGKIVGCGGWSRRRTPFGGDALAERDATELNPQIDAAKIRAFFIDPDYARRGIGKALLERCEVEARVFGFSRFEMVATLTGEKLYAAYGYTAGERIQHALSPTLNIEFVTMSKSAS
jgi:GNAT superfamily N-acetyltransferase